MKRGNLILAAAFICLYGIVAANSGNSKAVDLSAIQWVTQNPPTRDELASSVHVVEFWATWCSACKIQIPHLQSLAKKYQDHNVIFIGLADDKSVSTVREFVEKKSISYHIGMDNGLGDRLGVSSIPNAFIISHEGKILWSGNPGSWRFEQALKSAVNAAPKPILAGVDLGRFSYLRIKLSGGKNFAQSYHELERLAEDCNCSEYICACKIFGIVNNKIREKLAAAQDLRLKDPQGALSMYKEIADHYGGINLTQESKLAYDQLQQKLLTQMPSLAQID